MATPDRLIERFKVAPNLAGAPSSDYDLNAPDVRPEKRKLREAAVLIAVEKTAIGAQVYLTKRSSRLKHHPGQIAFPGGKRDEADTSLSDAALREAEEEIGLPRNHVRLIGNLPPHETVTGFKVTPVLGLVEKPFQPVSEPGEVAEVFTVPLAHLMDQSRFGIEGRIWQGSMRRYYAIPYGPYYIWGATARMLRALADRVAG